MFFAREWPDMLKRKKYLQCSVVFVVLQARQGVWVSNKLDAVAGKKNKKIVSLIIDIILKKIKWSKYVHSYSCSDIHWSKLKPNHNWMDIELYLVLEIKPCGLKF